MDDDKRASNSSLWHLMPAQAMDEMTCTLLNYRTYCKDHQLKLLNYLLEMTILEAIEVQVRLGQDNRAVTQGNDMCTPATELESRHELCGENHE